MKKLIFLFLSVALLAQSQSAFKIGRLKYSGGGDWYNDPSAEINLLKFVNENTSVKVNPVYEYVDVATDEIFDYAMLFITGHGTIKFSSSEKERLKTYLQNGGFLFVDDDYGIDKSFRKALKDIFPNKELVELPFSHGIYHQLYDFEYGPPKTHEHDNKSPRGYGLFINERLVVYYTVESNPSDGWADQRSHNDNEKTRLEALKFGANIITYVLTH